MDKATVKSEVGSQLGRKDFDLNLDAGKYFLNKISAKENSFLASQHFQKCTYSPKGCIGAEVSKVFKATKIHFKAPPYSYFAHQGWDSNWDWWDSNIVLHELATIAP